VVLGILWKVPAWQVSEVVDSGAKSVPISAEKRADLENEFRKTLAQIIAGLVILAGVYYTARRVAAAESTAKAALKQADISEEGQITERFTRAIEQLGNDEHIAIRLGGIYALERIAKDSPTKDHPQIMEVLTAYIREKSPLNVGEDKSDETYGQTPPADIQAVLTVLGRRTYDNAEQPLNLGQTDLHGTNLIRANLNGANLTMANLEAVRLNVARLENALLNGANLNTAFLMGADLNEANLTGADLNGANLMEANLNWADLNGATLNGATLNGANLNGAILYGADLSAANLHGATLIRAILNGANLTMANLNGADLNAADLNAANLYRATLIQANLNGANLNGANLNAANLNGANLNGANLNGADLNGADLENVVGLTQEQLESALSYDDATLPDTLEKSTYKQR